MSEHKAKQRVKASIGWIDPIELKLTDGGLITSSKMFDDVPVYLLPADRESYDAMVEQGAISITSSEWPGVANWTPWSKCDFWYQEIQRKRARAVLRAIGITQPKKQKGTQ